MGDGAGVREVVREVAVATARVEVAREEVEVVREEVEAARVEGVVVKVEAEDKMALAVVTAVKVVVAKGAAGLVMAQKAVGKEVGFVAAVA